MAIGVGLWYVNSWRYRTYFPPIFIACSPVPTRIVLTGGAMRSSSLVKLTRYSSFVTGGQLSIASSPFTTFVANAMQFASPHSLQLVFGRTLYTSMGLISLIVFFGSRSDISVPPLDLHSRPAGYPVRYRCVFLRKHT